MAVRAVRGRRPGAGDADGAHAAAIPVGAVVFFDHGVWADVGIAVGERLVLRRKHGVVTVEALIPTWVMGWISGEDFREAARERREASQHG